MKEYRSGDSSIQRRAEPVIRESLEKQLDIKLVESPAVLGSLKLDGYCAEPPTCVEIWAHQGSAKSAQKAKVMTDMCKLLLAEKNLGKPCRKIFVVADKDAVSHLMNSSWQREFAKEFGIEILVVDIDDTTRQQICQAQKAQYR